MPGLLPLPLLCCCRCPSQALPPAAQPDSILGRTAFITRNVGKWTVLSGAVGFLYHLVEAAAERAQGKHTITSGFYAGAAAGALAGAALTAPAITWGAMWGYPVAGAALSLCADLTGDIYPRMYDLSTVRPFGKTGNPAWQDQDIDIKQDPPTIMTRPDMLLWRQDRRKQLEEEAARTEH